MIAVDEQNLLRPYLLPGERVLWTGRPPRGLALRRSDLLLVPLSLVRGAVLLFGNILQSRLAVDDLFVLVPNLVALLVVVHLTLGRFVIDLWVRRRLVYGVTNRRILILRAGPSPRFRSLEIGYLPIFEYEEHRRGRGTIKFDIDESEGGRGRARWTPALSPAMRFDEIDDARTVYELVRKETERWRREQYGEDLAARNFIG